MASFRRARSWAGTRRKGHYVRLEGPWKRILDVRKEGPRTWVFNHCGSVFVFYSCLNKPPQTQPFKRRLGSHGVCINR